MSLSLAACLAVACGDDTKHRATDAGHDSGVVDAGQDATISDAAVDAGQDAAISDAAIDAGQDAARAIDASDDDAGSIGDAGEMLPQTLADTGLYSDFAKETLAEGVKPFEPQFALWSDGATKKRYLYLPPNTKIDTSDMDAWVFPVGTKVWKEFTRDGIRVETRILYKTSQGWFMMPFIWNQAQTKAVAAIDGMQNANGTQHDVPASGDCRTCHNGMADKLLGVSAIQLSHQKAGSVTLSSLINDGLLSDPPAAAFTLPGTATDQAALGALHANCGHCHNPLGAAADMAPSMQLKLLVGSLASVAATTTYSTTVGVDLMSKPVPSATKRIVAGMPAASGLLLRLEAMRGPVRDALAMPTLATEKEDSATEDAVRTWIMSLQ